jgi:serine O-acetyltransferase
VNSEPARRRDFGEPLGLANVVNQLSDLRSLAQRRRYSGPTPKLPSRETTIAIVDELVAALYPRHFGPQGLTAGKVNQFVADTSSPKLSAASGSDVVTMFQPARPPLM